MVATPDKELTEAQMLEEAAANLFLQSEALMQQGRDLRAESMRLRELARRLRPQKPAARENASHA